MTETNNETFAQSLARFESELNRRFSEFAAEQRTRQDVLERELERVLSAVLTNPTSPPLDINLGSATLGVGSGLGRAVGSAIGTLASPRIRRIVSQGETADSQQAYARFRQSNADMEEAMARMAVPRD